MLHHVGIEVAPAEIERSIEFWELLGFDLVEPPSSLAEYTWLEREGTQIHLMPTESPTVPGRGHTAVVATDFDEAVERLRERGFAVEPRHEHWGAPRARAVAPGGHLVELMAAPPTGSTS
jgi:catechol 2,3-dioxygenase-like lactoylglutathione lyase family enzyme